MCDVENCVRIRELQPVMRGVDSSCIYGASSSPQNYAGSDATGTAYGAQAVQY